MGKKNKYLLIIRNNTDIQTVGIANNESYSYINEFAFIDNITNRFSNYEDLVSKLNEAKLNKYFLDKNSDIFLYRYDEEKQRDVFYEVLLGRNANMNAYTSEKIKAKKERNEQKIIDACSSVYARFRKYMETPEFNDIYKNNVFALSKGFVNNYKPFTKEIFEDAYKYYLYDYTSIRNMTESIERYKYLSSKYKNEDIVNIASMTALFNHNDRVNIINKLREEYKKFMPKKYENLSFFDGYLELPKDEIKEEEKQVEVYDPEKAGNISLFDYESINKEEKPLTTRQKREKVIRYFERMNSFDIKLVGQKGMANLNKLDLTNATEEEKKFINKYSGKLLHTVFLRNRLQEEGYDFQATEDRIYYSEKIAKYLQNDNQLEKAYKFIQINKKYHIDEKEKIKIKK